MTTKHIFFLLKSCQISVPRYLSTFQNKIHPIIQITVAHHSFIPWLMIGLACVMNCPGDELSWVRIVLGMRCIALGTKFPGYELSSEWVVHILWTLTPCSGFWLVDCIYITIKNRLHCNLNQQLIIAIPEIYHCRINILFAASCSMCQLTIDTLSMKVHGPVGLC